MSHYFFNVPILLSVFLTFLNDHVLKYTWPGWWTGILSDFTGLLFFPLFFAAAIEFVNGSAISRKVFDAIYIMVAIAFGLLKATPALAQFFERVFSYLFYRIQIVADPWDLLALFSLLVARKIYSVFLKRHDTRWN